MEVVSQLRVVLQKFPALKHAKFPSQVKIVEVGPRDGLQNEKKLISAATKIALIDRLSASGLQVVETTSFVSPKAVPQMADNLEVLAGITQKSGVEYPALVPNIKGLEGAKKAGCKEIAVFAAASEGFSKKNTNCTIQESFERLKPVVEEATQLGMKVRGYISCVMGCPYDGEIKAESVLRVARELRSMGCGELSLGDTVGVGSNEQTFEMYQTLLEEFKAEDLASHFHNTYEKALGNLLVALSMQIPTIDSSVAGLGGCPYAKGAKGNVPTEDVLFLCELLGIQHGVNIERIYETGAFIAAETGRDYSPKAKLADYQRIEQFREALYQ